MQDIWDVLCYNLQQDTCYLLYDCPGGMDGTVYMIGLSSSINETVHQPLWQVLRDKQFNQYLSVVLFMYKINSSLRSVASQVLYCPSARGQIIHLLQIAGHLHC